MPPALEDRYRLERGRVLMSGVQALVRLPLDQHRADRERGLRSETLISGYPGSPLGGLDQELSRRRELCVEHGVHHVPGVNEELAATAAWGSQLAFQLEGFRPDGVLAMWYGKGPGVDRAADSLRHGNLIGVSRTGGALALAGDDPGSKSSTIPSASELVLQSLHMPVFHPGSVQEVLDLGLHAFACSRASGLWSAMKVVTDVADAVATVELAPDRVVPEMPPDGAYEHVPDAHLVGPAVLERERTLLGPRRELALAYVRDNRLDRVEGARGAGLGIVAAGKQYYDLRHALRRLEVEPERDGIRILKPAVIWPLDPATVREFARGLEDIVVVEEKRSFLEAQLKELLYGVADAPRIAGRDLLPADLDADRIERALAGRLGRVAPPAPEAASPSARTPFFCSGCPHSRSTKVPDGSLVGVGIGCHTMVVLSPEGRGDTIGLTQMGGEGAQWIGISPFTGQRHLFQNLGDGTFFHSGSLAIRAAVAAGVNITYKLLYNSAIAMTGGQRSAGALDVPALTRLLEAEGVRRIVVTTEDTTRYRGVALAPSARVRPRAELLDAQRELAAVEGVTVLVHDQECAAEQRRKRKRGLAPEPAERLWINERVCEGCGDCGAKSSCLSVVPVTTEFGRKTQIHQPSCNKDYSCLDGDCPAFLTVVPGAREPRAVPAPPVSLDEPRRTVSDRAFAVRMVGIGGTGVVTVNQVLAMAALLDGLHATGLDQTGLSQKGGPVVSDLLISREPLAAAAKAPAGSADLYLGFDVMGAAHAANLAAASPDRTVAVVSTRATATGRMVTDVDAPAASARVQRASIDAATRSADNAYLDAHALSERLFGDHMMANTLLLGAAYQRGLLPVTAAALEQAMTLNGAAVDKNLRAFAWGRAAVADPNAVEAATRAPAAPCRALTERELVDSVTDPGELRRLLEIRVPELVAYQDLAYARRYVAVVARVHSAEPRLAESVARNLFKLMAYKDEYEVARLLLDAREQAKLRTALGDDARVWFNLHPPLLRALGLRRKVKLGRWFVPALRLLRGLRRLRGTKLDPFGRAHVRRVERGLIAEYEQLVDHALHHLGPEALDTAGELLRLPEIIRGYEQVKLANVARYQDRARRLRDELAASRESAGT